MNWSDSPALNGRRYSCGEVAKFQTPFSWRLILGLLLIIPSAIAQSADYEDARSAFERGDYETCIELTQAEVDRGVWMDLWARKLMEALLITGEYQQATEVYELTAEKFSSSLPLRMLGAKAYRFAGKAEVGNRLLDEIPDLVANAPWRYNGSDNQLAKGRFLLEQGEDARDILKLFYDRVLQANAKNIDAHVAVGELALSKADYQEAVKSLNLALELRPTDPEICFLLAKAWATSDGEKSASYLQRALKLNPKHPGSLLLEVGKLIDAEEYEQAESVLKEVLSVNAKQPLAWAYRAAIAHLKGEYRQEGECRVEALRTWNLNPEVDYLIGNVLSKHYRFAESVKYQRRALKMDPGFAPARFQLAQDLLRVGQDAEGWSIVDQVSDADPYNVVAYNLQTLQGRLSGFSTIEVPGFIIRMESREARIYGPRVVALLQEAYEFLTDKYDVELKEPVTVEIFPRQSDFAIRTFGLPGGEGFLGVCFGSLITANSPASQGDQPSNWESVLWHEFCHVVTLQKTNNRMPRWLSEGISVYEEVQRNPRWGQRMTPRYKAMILGEDFVPLSQLSSAFLSPKSALHLQFAYYESSLAVEYMIERHGMERLKRLLSDLGMGVTMQQAMGRIGQASALDAEFEQFAKERAKSFLPDTDFDSDSFPENLGLAQTQQWLEKNPDSYVAQMTLVQHLVRERKWELAEEAAEKLVELYPDNADPGGGLDWRVNIAKAKNDTNAELEALRALLEFSCDDVKAYQRILDLLLRAGEWEEVLEYADLLLAVQPMIPIGHEAMAEAAEELERSELAIPALKALGEMEPIDPSGLHYALANAHFAMGDLAAARIEILNALEFAPRYREALRLLVKIDQSKDTAGVQEVVEDRTGIGEAIRTRAPVLGVPPSPLESDAVGL